MLNAQKYANKRMKKGFSLVELIVVMIIMGIIGWTLNSNVFAAKDEANKTAELEVIGSMKILVSTVKAQNNGNIFDITNAANGVGDKIKNNLTSAPTDLIYFVTSTYSGQNNSTNLVAFANTDEGRIKIKESVEKLELKIDGVTGTPTTGNFRYVNTCESTVTDGTDCYYQVQLSKSGTLPNWETTISPTDLSTAANTSGATNPQTWVKLNQ